VLIDAYKAGLIVAWKHDAERGSAGRFSLASARREFD